MTSKREQITELIEQGNVSVENINEALRIVGISPTHQSWQHFIERLMVWLGGLAIAFSCLFFIAHNWAEMGRLTKFALVEVTLLLTIATYWKFEQHAIHGKVSLLMASIFLGVLLALFGQTYQTGADPWQLFFNWALLMLPWAFIGRFPAIWIIWILLMNLSIILYHQAFRSVIRLIFSSEIQMLWLIFLFNLGAHIVWELLSKSRPWLAQSWAKRLIATTAGVTITWLVLYAIADYKTPGIWPILIWAGWMAGLFYYYRTVKIDLFMLAGFCMSGIVVIIASQIKYVMDDLHPGSFLYIALLLIALGTGSAIWLRKIHRELLS